MNKIDIKTDYLYNKNGRESVIFHFSDLHFNTNTESSLFDKIITAVKEEKPDYIMITGDLIDLPDITSNKNKIGELTKFITDLGKLSKVLISIGNHDVHFDRDFEYFNVLDKISNVYILNNKSYLDDNVYVSGFTMPNIYYYNIYGRENYHVILDEFNKNKHLIKGLPKDVVKIGLFHSPINLMNDSVFKEFNEYDLILSGHMHNGMLFKWMYPFFPKNRGLVGPSKKMFPKISRGRIDRDNLSLIISGGVTKLSLESSVFLSKLNFIYNISINKIILTNKKGR